MINLFVNHRDGETGEMKSTASNNHNQLKTMMGNIKNKMKTKTADVPLQSTLGMIGWNPASSVDQAMEYFHLDIDNGVSPKVLSSRNHHVAGKGQDVEVNDARGYGHLLRYLAQNFINKVTHFRVELFFFLSTMNKIYCYLSSFAGRLLFQTV